MHKKMSLGGVLALLFQSLAFAQSESFPNSALIQAIEKQKVAVVEAALEKNSRDMNKVSGDLGTPLIYAVLSDIRGKMRILTH